MSEHNRLLQAGILIRQLIECKAIELVVVYKALPPHDGVAHNEHHWIGIHSQEPSFEFECEPSSRIGLQQIARALPAWNGQARRLTWEVRAGIFAATPRREVHT